MANRYSFHSINIYEGTSYKPKTDFTNTMESAELVDTKYCVCKLGFETLEELNKFMLKKRKR